MYPDFNAHGERLRQRMGRMKPFLDSVRSSTTRSAGRLFAPRQRSLVNRLSAFLLIGTIILYLIGVAGIYFTTSRLVESSMRKQAEQWISELEELGTPLYFSRKANPSQIEKRVRSIAEISFVRYYDSSGKRSLGQFGDYAKEPARPLGEQQVKTMKEFGKTESPYLFDSTPDESEHVHVISPVRVRSIRTDGLFDFNYDAGAEDVRTIGYIDLAIDPSSYRAQIYRSIAYGSFATALILLLAMVVGRRLIRKALHPLTELQAPLARLARGEIDVRVTSGGDREIAAISDALNVTINALKERNEILHRMAERDSLTGLFNRNYFSRMLDNELAWVKRAEKTSALLFIDLDRFKYVNDSLGHGAGDRLLVEVAGLIKTRMRGHDIVSRFGGDEFTVIAHDVTKEAVTAIAEGINNILHDYQFVERQQVFTISCTIGIAMITGASHDAEEVLSQADAACYEAKSGGRNRHVLYEPDQQQKLMMETDIGWSQTIKDAIQKDSFTLFYQPIVSLTGARREFYEVLLRMPDRDGKVLMPGLFLPIAERFGLLAEIDRWVIGRALKALAAFRAQGRDIVFSINLSGQALAEPGLVEHIKGNLISYGLPPDALVFEITEQTAVRYIDKARQLIEDLLGLGCRFAIDDFGVGFSSFTYLKRLPVSLVKIDGSFVRKMDSEPVDQVMVKSVVEIAKALGKEVVAEFVQNEATVDLLKSYGVDFVQGRYLGTPSETLPERS